MWESAIGGIQKKFNRRGRRGTQRTMRKLQSEFRDWFSAYVT